MYRAISILLLLLVACSGRVPVVAKGKIAVPSGTHYCVKVEVGPNRIPVVTCTPNRKLCEWGYGRVKKYGSWSDVKSVTPCYAKPVYGSR